MGRLFVENEYFHVVGISIFDGFNRYRYKAQKSCADKVNGMDAAQDVRLFVFFYVLFTLKTQL
ncbi:hypothetical protein CTN06_17330 [Pectobacterium zantedeschiae]|uniref:Uncharacterized protein n=1 Tax=Pectobacterium zantedeschiae TaxID=2034769 RepID=A0A9X8JES0_9GAMM|nr:hypothetical protein CTN06_17330 [Pectobacterium zantedeschiae]RYC39398.1 hypothetical protein CLR69_20105 [Pectobacterium zantedeschiae]